MRENEYKQLVLEEFDKRWKTHKLPHELIASTRKDLKELSIQTSTLRYDPKDEIILASFFGARENKAAYQIAVQNSKAEDFRTLNNFLNKREIDPSLKNINLLAWLMDFRPRPYHPDLKIPPQEFVPNIDKDPKEQEDSSVITDQPSSPEKPTNYQSFIIYGALLIVAFVIGYFAMKRPSGARREKCMYWNSDHYEPISCNQKPPDSSLAVIALDKRRIEQFKKITRADTLTAASIGKVWYIRINGQVEYYTDGGPHPIYPERRLLKLTATILNNDYKSRVH